MADSKRNIVVWSWSRDPSLVPVDTLVAEGKVEVALWVSMLGEKDFRSKPFSYVPAMMLKQLAEQHQRKDVCYKQDTTQLRADLTRFVDIYSRVNYSKGLDYFEHVNLFHLYYQYFTHILLSREVDGVVYFPPDST